MINLKQKTAFCFYLLTLVMKSPTVGSIENDQNRNETSDTVEVHSQVLSRRKRFLVFPEGSSVQLVFCNTFPMIFEIGDIFLYGYTAALAWELPQDPYSPFDHHADPLHRRMDNAKSIYYTDYDGKILFKRPYRRKPIVNPAFAKRSVDEKETSKFKMHSRRQLHAANRRDFFNMERMDGRGVQFHRSSRALLYEKIESLLKALGTNGRPCMLKALCQVGQSRDQGQSSFLQELLRAVFTLPKGQVFEEDHHKEYDTAHAATGSCDQLYSDCVATDASAIPSAID